MEPVTQRRSQERCCHQHPSLGSLMRMRGETRKGREKRGRKEARKENEGPSFYERTIRQEDIPESPQGTPGELTSPERGNARSVTTRPRHPLHRPAFSLPQKTDDAKEANEEGCCHIQGGGLLGTAASWGHPVDLRAQEAGERKRAQEEL